MKRYILILLTVIISFSSCSVDTNDDITTFTPILLPVDSADVPLEFNYGESYPITVNYALPNGCHYFNDIHYEVNGASRFIAIRALVNNNQTCTQSIIEEEHTFTLKCTQTEPYVLKFWKGKDAQGIDQYLIFEVPVL